MPLPERYISFAQIILSDNTTGGLQPPPPPPVPPPRTLTDFKQNFVLHQARFSGCQQIVDRSNLNR